ncbi:hypothetical protein J2769_001049 [Acinetobacter guillouiae]|nr:hypothetical protein [Acinetobacter guillouiae]
MGVAKMDIIGYTLMRITVKLVLPHFIENV